MKHTRLLLLMAVMLLCSVAQTYAENLTFDDWVSTNTEDGSTSSNTYDFTVSEPSTLIFDWEVSSEANWDKLIVTLDGVTILSVSGSCSATSYKPVLDIGEHTLVVSYSKDGSASSGDDRGAVSNIRIVAGEVADAMVAGGTWGELTWVLSQEGKLVIEGSGAMPNSSWSGAPWYSFRSYITEVEIGEQITSIGSHAFNECRALTSIVIPESVASIGDYAFYYCTNLTSVTIPEGITVLPRYAFQYCASLESLSLPESLTTIEKAAISHCPALKELTLPDSVRIIGDYAFDYTGFSTLIIPEGVTEVGISAFYGCKNLTTISFPESLDSIGNYALAFCDNLSSIVCKAIAPPACGDSTFHCLDKYIPVCVPAASVEDYRNAEYWNEFTNIQSVNSIVASGTCGDNLTWVLNDAGELVVAGTGAMEDYSAMMAPWSGYVNSIKNVVVKGGVTSIGSYAFYHCDSLAAVSIPESVIKIGDYAFYGCVGLTSVAVPESVDTIGARAFDFCDGLSAVYINNLNAWYDISFGGPWANPLVYAHDLYLNGELVTELVLPDTMTVIKAYTFDGCGSLTSIVIPEGVTTIGRSALSRCDGLTSITIPESVVSIGVDAFALSGGLTFITSRALTPPLIGGYLTFDGVDKSIPVYVPVASVEAYRNAAYWSEFTNIQPILPSGTCGDNLTWKLTVEGELIIEGTGAMDSYSYVGYSQPSDAPWGEYADSIKSVTIKEGVTSIGAYAFYHCDSLAAVSIPEGLTVIGNSAFCYCGNLVSVTIPEGVAEIGAYAFDFCYSLTAVHISSMKAWYDIDFGGYYANPLPYAKLLYLNGALITDVTIPDTLTVIKAYTFDGCGSLVNVTIPENVTTIEESAFSRCDSLASINIPEGVTSIEFCTFFECFGLRAIDIPESVTSIGGYAFADCYSLASIVCNAAIPPTVSSFTTFMGVDESIPVYVPASSVEDYRNAAYWSEFTNIQAISTAITVNQYGSGTYCSAYALDFSEVAGLKAYAATGYNTATGVVTLTRVMTTQPGEGLFIEGDPGSYKVPILESSDDNTLNMLVGTLVSTTVNATDGNYVNYKYTVKAGDAEPLFYPFADGSTLSANRAYLQIPKAWLPAVSEARAIRLRFVEGETTDIEEPEFANDSQSATVYDLHGRRVENPTTGVYIVNGKKMVIRN